MIPTALSESISDLIHDIAWMVAENIVNNSKRPRSRQQQLDRFLELKAQLVKTLTEAVMHYYAMNWMTSSPSTGHPQATTQSSSEDLSENVLLATGNQMSVSLVGCR